MNLLEMLESVGGTQSLGNLAGSLGLDASKANDLVGAIAPALMDGLKKQAGAEGGLAGFTKALQTGGHQRYIENQIRDRYDFEGIPIRLRYKKK